MQIFQDKQQWVMGRDSVQKLSDLVKDYRLIDAWLG